MLRSRRHRRHRRDQRRCQTAPHFLEAFASKGTDLRSHAQADPDGICHVLNTQPRKSLHWKSTDRPTLIMPRASTWNSSSAFGGPQAHRIHGPSRRGRRQRRRPPPYMP